VSRASLIALAVCGVAAGLEGVAAGTGVRQRFAALRMPRWSPSLTLWIVIGAAYYLVCFMVLTRLLALPSSGQVTTAIALLLTVMLVNAYWNFLFFRRRDLRLSFLAGVVYSVTAVGLFVFLCQLDTPAAWWLSPYVAYLVYANAFGYGVWQANQADRWTTPGEPIDLTSRSDD
jgi:benzodiazapine receptor